MKGFPDKHDEYKKRHDELWPEMKKLLEDHGCKRYSIWLDEELSFLFGCLKIEDEQRWKKVPETEINKKWWTFMENVMDTNPDSSPISMGLKKAFEL